MSAPSTRSLVSVDDLRAHVLEAYALGLGIDLDDVVYGPGTDGSGYNGTTMEYYPLLAGHAALTNASTVVEIGTHYGGSTLALLAGMRAGSASDPKLFTMDVTELNVDRLAREPEIVRLTGDSTELGFVRSLAALVPDVQPDLLYIDALKDAGYVLRTLHNVARAGLEPTWLVLDDIQATESMRSLWDVLEAAEPEQSYLLTRDFPHMRDPHFGYAVIHVAGTAGLLGRCVELMQRLGLDTSGMDDSDDRFAEVAAASPSQTYAAAHPDAPVLDSNARELTLLEGLARAHVHGDGEVVDFGCTVGTSTRALAEGIAANPLAHDGQRVHAYDSFVNDHASVARVVAGSVDPGGSLLPTFDAALGDHPANVYAITPHLARWYGAPIELMVAGAVRTPRVAAHVVAEFLPHFLAGKTLLVHREALLPHRPWIAVAVAYLHQHLELLAVDHALTVHGFVRPVPADMVTRLVEDRFTPDERVDLVRTYADGLHVPLHRWSFLVQAGIIAARFRLLAQAVEIEAELRSLGTDGDSHRAQRLAFLQNRIEKASAETPEEGR